MINKYTIDYLDKLSAIPKGAGSRAAKIKILEEGKEHLQEYMDIAFNPYRVFGVSKLPKKVTHEYFDYNDYSFVDLCKSLERKRGQNNNETKQEIRNIIAAHPKPWQSYLEQAVLKKLRIGVEVKTLNKAGYDIPTFECLLADPNKENSLEGTEFPCYVQAKFDGVRCIRMPNGTFFGRNGRNVPNVQLSDHVKVGDEFKDYVLDGEFYSHKRSFNEIVGLFQRDDEVLPDDIVFIVFNIIHIDDWEDRNCTLKYNMQLEMITLLQQHSEHIESVALYTREAYSEEEAINGFNELMDEGFEGAMVRNKRSHYSWKRVKVKDGILTKLKPFDHADCKITGYYEGENRNEGRLGGFYLDYNGVEVKCGGGFTDEMREDFWSRADEFVGKWCRVKYTELTEDGSLRFPIWDSIREDKE